jgi:hypothetical protein
MTKREQELTEALEQTKEAVKELLEVVDEFTPFLPPNPNKVQVSHAKARTEERERAVRNGRRVIRLKV